MNINLLVELKKEYTIQLLNILDPIIYDGLISIYQQAKKTQENDTILKTFQNFLKRIPKWNDSLLTKEYERIISKTTHIPWFIDLIKAVIKANINILAVSDVSEELYRDINIINFIHSVYIECAREFWLDPYLFYHKNTNIDQKRNTMKIFETIKISIENAIRRTLPMKIILNEYLGKEENMSKEFNFDINMNIADLNNIPLLLKKSKEVKSFDTRQTGGYDIFQKNNNTDTNNKILKMIDDQNIKLSESKNTKSFKSTKKTSTSRRKSNSRNSSSTIKKIINESIKKNHTDTNSNSPLAISCYLSKRGEDFSTGGFYCLNFESYCIYLNDDPYDKIKILKN